MNERKRERERERIYLGNIGIMERKMETTIMGYIGIIEKERETETETKTETEMHRHSAQVSPAEPRCQRSKPLSMTSRTPSVCFFGLIIAEAC